MSGGVQVPFDRRLTMRGRGTQEWVVGWYAPVEVLDETGLWRGVEAVVQMRLVAVGWKVEGYNGAVACSRGRWYLKGTTMHAFSRWKVSLQAGGRGTVTRS